MLPWSSRTTRMRRPCAQRNPAACPPSPLADGRCSAHGAASVLRQTLAAHLTCTELRRYADALAALPEGDSRHKLLCNRSLALGKALRHAEALAAADAAAAAGPAWPKAHWRRGSALRGLQRFQEAALAFLEAWRLSGGAPVPPLPTGRALRAAPLSPVCARLCNLLLAMVGTSAFPAGREQVHRPTRGSSGDPALYAGDGECEVALRASVQRLTREQLALGLLRLLADLEAHARPTHIKHTLSIRGLGDTVHFEGFVASRAKWVEAARQLGMCSQARM